MNATGVKCGNCSQYHESAQAVRECYFPPRRSSVPGAVASFRLPPQATGPAPTVVTIGGQNYNTNGATQAQVDYMIDLGATTTKAISLTKTGASHEIERLKKEKRKMSDTAPNRVKTKIPLNMLHDLRDGYYASRPDDSRPYTFFRVSRPNRGNYKGTLKIQTQHGPDLKLALVIYPGDRVYWHNMVVEDDLLLVVVDQRGCALAYAEKLGKCMRCGTELTDDRSRWYGIGPECERHWPEIINEIDDTKGRYRPGSGN